METFLGIYFLGTYRSFYLSQNFLTTLTLFKNTLRPRKRSKLSLAIIFIQLLLRNCGYRQSFEMEMEKYTFIGQLCALNTGITMARWRCYSLASFFSFWPAALKCHKRLRLRIRRSARPENVNFHFAPCIFVSSYLAAPRISATRWGWVGVTNVGSEIMRRIMKIHYKRNGKQLKGAGMDG